MLVKNSIICRYIFSHTVMQMCGSIFLDTSIGYLNPLRLQSVMLLEVWSGISSLIHWTGISLFWENTVAFSFKSLLHLSLWHPVTVRKYDTACRSHSRSSLDLFTLEIWRKKGVKHSLFHVFLLSHIDVYWTTKKTIRVNMNYALIFFIWFERDMS